MAWFKVDDGLPDHRKVRQLKADKAAAMGVWVLCGAWSASNLTDGFVPDEIVARYDTRGKYAGRLVDVGLWEPAEQDGETGYVFHDWADVQPTKSDVEARRAEVKRRVAKHRAGKAQSPEDDGPGGGNARRNGTSNGGCNALQEEGVTVPRAQAGAHARAGVPARPGPTRPGPIPAGHAEEVGRQSHTARVDALAATAHSGAAHRLVEAYAATCNRRPPSKILSRLAVEVDALLAEQWQPSEITAALDVWGAKPLGPGALQAVAHEVANRRSGRSSTDQNIAAFLADLEPAAPRLRAIGGSA